MCAMSTCLREKDYEFNFTQWSCEQDLALEIYSQDILTSRSHSQPFTTLLRITSQGHAASTNSYTLRHSDLNLSTGGILDFGVVASVKTVSPVPMTESRILIRQFWSFSSLKSSFFAQSVANQLLTRHWRIPGQPGLFSSVFGHASSLYTKSYTPRTQDRINQCELGQVR